MDSTADVVREKIFDFAYEMAMRDATLQKAYYDKDKENNKKHLLANRCAKGKVKEYIDCIISGNGIPNFFKTEEIVEFAFSKYLGNGYPDFTFGNTQKLINMTAKYMFISCYHDSTLRKNFKICHCPMDKIIIDEAVKQFEEKYKDKGILSGKVAEIITRCNETIEEYNLGKTISEGTFKTWKGYLKNNGWSKIKKNDIGQYIFFQELVLDLLVGKDLSPLEYDLCFWSQDSVSWLENDSEYL